MDSAQIADPENFVDHGDPYYKKIKKLIMYRTCYKNLEEKLLKAESEIFRLKSHQYDEFNKLKQDYELLTQENIKLRQQLSNNSNNELSNKSSLPQSKYEEMYKSIEESVGTNDDSSSDDEENNDFKSMYLDLQNKYTELNEEFTNLSAQFVDITNNLKQSNETNDRLTAQLEQYDNQIADLKRELAEKKREIKILKSFQKDDQINLAEIELIKSKNVELNKTILELAAKAEGEAKLHEGVAKNFNKIIKELKNENLTLQQKVEISERKLQHYIELGDEIKSDNARLSGQLSQLLAEKQQTVFQVVFEKDKKSLKNLYEENSNLNKTVQNLTKEKSKMFNDIRTLILSQFRNINFDMNWDELVEFLVSKLNDLKLISSDRDLLFERFAKTNKETSAIENSFNAYKETLDSQLAHKEQLLQSANQKLEEYALNKPTRDFHMKVSCITTQHYRNLNTRVEKLLNIIDGKGQNEISLHTIIIFSVAINRIKNKTKTEFDPMKILTFVSPPTRYNILDRIDSCIEEVRKNDSLVKETVNEFITQNKHNEKIIKEISSNANAYKDEISNCVRKIAELEKENESMVPKTDYDVVNDRYEREKAKNQQILAFSEKQHLRFKDLKSKYNEVRHKNNELQSHLTKLSSQTNQIQENIPVKTKTKHQKKFFLNEKPQSNIDLRSMTAMSINDFKSDLQSMKKSISSPTK